MQVEWTKCERKLPKLGQRVLGVNQFGEMQVCSLEKYWKDKDAQFIIVGVYEFYPRYWTPLPLPFIENL